MGIMCMYFYYGIIMIWVGGCVCICIFVYVCVYVYVCVFEDSKLSFHKHGVVFVQKMICVYLARAIAVYLQASTYISPEL